MKPISLEGLSEHRRAVTNQDIRQHNICICGYLHFLFFLTPAYLSHAPVSHPILNPRIKEKKEEKQKYVLLLPQPICIHSFSKSGQPIPSLSKSYMLHIRDVHGMKK